MLKEKFNELPKKVRNIIYIILLLMLAYTGGCFTGYYRSTKISDNTVTDLSTAITGTIERGEGNSIKLEHGITGIEEGLSITEEELQTIGNKLEEGISTSEDIRELSETIGDRSQRIGDYSNQLEDGYSDLERGLSEAQRIIDELLKEN